MLCDRGRRQGQLGWGSGGEGDESPFSSCFRGFGCLLLLGQPGVLVGHSSFSIDLTNKQAVAPILSHLVLTPRDQGGGSEILPCSFLRESCWQIEATRLALAVAC